MAESLAVKYRPRTFSDVCSQSSVIKILTRQIETGEFKNAVLFNGASGCGKAQPLTSKVFTPEGYKLMKDIHIGDTVVAGDGTATRVLGVFPQGIRPIYKITFSDRSTIEVADNHLNSVWHRKNGHREDCVMTTEELIDWMNKNPKHSLRLDTPVIDCWQDNNITVDPYLLGCLIGDGSLHNNFGFTNSEPDIIDKVNTILERDYKMCLKHVENYDYGIVYKDRDKKRYSCYYKELADVTISTIIDRLESEGYPRFDGATIISLANGTAPVTLKKYPELANCITVKVSDSYVAYNEADVTLRKQLDELGMLVNSVDKHIPKTYLYSSFETRLNVLRGLMDTDGDKGGRDFSTSSPKLAEDFETLTRSLGIQVTRMLKTNVTYTTIKDGKKVRLPGKDSHVFYLHPNNDYKIFTCRRIEDTFTPVQNAPRKVIKSIEYVRDDQCQCIYVAADCHTYFTDHMTLTHNTTCARIVANMLNNGQGEPIEIDAASNNGVENVRQIIHDAQERSIDSKYKIYIIDECHSLSNQAWQAFLKCIEEPPKYTIFIFCTTDPQKIPETITNRVQRFSFNRISTDLIKERLAYICRMEGFVNYEEAVDYLSRMSEGGMRAAITLLDKCSSYSTDLCIDNVLAALGNYSYDTFFSLINHMIDGNEAEVLNIISRFYDEGNDLKLFVDQFLNFCMDVTKYALFKTTEVTRIPSSMEAQLLGSTNFDNSAKYYMYVVDKILVLKNMLKNDNSPRSTIEILFLQITRCV